MRLVLFLINNYLLTLEGLESPGSDCWWNRWPLLPVRCNYQVSLISHDDRFCTAPIDVVKIRLQLQTGPLAIRTCSASTSSGALPLVKQIFRHEGITVGKCPVSPP